MFKAQFEMDGPTFILLLATLFLALLSAIK